MAAARSLVACAFLSGALIVGAQTATVGPCPAAPARVGAGLPAPVLIATEEGERCALVVGCNGRVAPTRPPTPPRPFGLSFPLTRPS